MNPKSNDVRFAGFSRLLMNFFLIGVLVASMPDYLSGQSLVSGEAGSPEITSIEQDGDSITVEVFVPKGLKKVVLEGKSRLGVGAWVPRGVQHLDGSQDSTVTFNLKMSQELEMLRVRAASSTPLPSSFYKGQKEFDEVVSDTNNDGAIRGEVDGPAVAVDAAFEKEADDREVQESDIWAFRGNTLYFFNRLEGLQVIDVSDPANAVVKKRYYLPAAGEEMYVLDDRHVALLVNDFCGYFNNETGSQIVVIDTAPDQPVVTGSINIPGNIQETRLVGNVLYTASSRYQRITDEEGNSFWTAGTNIVSVLLADPTTPVKVDEIFVTGYATAVQATDKFFFVSTRGNYPYYNSTVHIVDIDNLDGSIALKSSLNVRGWIKDKFKINLNGEILSVIAELRNDRGRLTSTKLLNFSLSNPEKPRTLGSVEVGKNETLFATRFDGDRVYIVTFLRIDPLWIVDNSVPEKPEVLGELEIPGWSTYIHPMGDRLITMGIDNVNGWRPAVQLFDVSNPQKPSLLSKVPLGDNWGWSEANRNEKAFKVLEDRNLILVPMSAWSSETNTSEVGTRLIDFDADSLTQRGLIEHDFTPRRATMYQDVIYSISNHELVSVDPADRDNPELLGELTLARPVDKVLELDDHIVSSYTTWSGNRNISISLVHKNDLHTELGHITLTRDSERDFQLTDLFLHRGSAWAVLSSESYQKKTPVPPLPDGAKAPDSELQTPYFTQVQLVIIDVDTESGKLTQSATKSFEFEDIGWYPQFKARVLNDNSLVLHQEGAQHYYWFFSEAISFLPYYSGSTQLFLTFDISNQNDIQFLNKFTPTYIDGSENDFWRSSSDLFWNGNSVVYSTRTTRHYSIKNPEIPASSRVADDIAFPFREYWATQNELIKIDFSDPSHPTQFPGAELPGNMIGQSHDGQVIYTSGYTYEEDGSLVPDSLAIHANAYDDIQVSLIDSIKTHQFPNHSLSMDNGLLITTRTEKPTEDSQYQLNYLELNNDGNLIANAALDLNSYIYGLRDIDGLIFVSFGSRDGIAAYDFSSPASPELFKSWRVPGCVWPNMDELFGSAESGFWVPLGTYGIMPLPVGE